MLLLLLMMMMMVVVVVITLYNSDENNDYILPTCIISKRWVVQTPELCVGWSVWVVAFSEVLRILQHHV